MSLKEEIVSIEKLVDAESFRLWKFEINIYLKANSLHENVAVQKDTKVTSEEVKDAKAQRLILNSIDKNLKIHIMDCTTAYEMFVKLCDIFEGSEERNKTNILQEFFNYQYKNQTMNTLITDIQNLAMRLKSLKQTINDEMIINKIITCLPENYKMFATAWESTSSDLKTLSNLTNRLLLEESRQSASNNHNLNKEEIAYKAVNNNKKKRCFICNKMGHIKTECRSAYNKVKPKCSICKKDNHNEQNCFFRNKTNKQNYKNERVYISSENKTINTRFVVDSGCTSHMTKDLNILDNIEEVTTEISIANNSSMIANQIGTVNANNCQLKKTLYVPDLTQNLMSVNAITNNSGTVLFTKEKVEVSKNNKVILTGKKEDGMYYININKTFEEKSLLTKEKGTALEWHKRLGHPGKDVLEVLKDVADGIKIEGKCKLDDQCEICIKAKQGRLPFSTQRQRAERKLEIIHSDVCGPFETETYDKNRYFLTLMDDYTHFTKVYLIKHKNQVPEIIKNYIEESERELKEKVSILRCDNGGEYKSNEFRTWCLKKGIKIDYSVPYTPQLNGKAERLNRTILEKVRALLFNSDLKNEMWGEAVLCSIYLINRLPSETINKLTPYEMWFGKRPNLSNIHEFGSTVYAKTLGNLRKLEPRGRKLVLIGYTRNGYRLWNQTQRKIEVARDIIIVHDKENKGKMILITTDNTQEDIDDLIESNDKTIQETVEENTEEHNITKEDIDDNIFHDSKNISNLQEFDDELITDEENDNIITTDSNETENTEMTRSKRTRKVPVRYPDHALLTYNEVVSGSNNKLWQKAIDSEKESLLKNNTWDIVDVKEAEGKKILSNKWVFRVKDDGTHKARLVVRGFEQKGLNFDEIYSPVVSQSALKSLFAICSSKNYEMMSFDVKTAFLYGELTESIYMSIPLGFDEHSDKICRLNKSLYGLKQAPYTWNNKFKNSMLKLGLKPTKTDHCVFTNEDKTIIIAIYVDDGLAIGKNKTDLLCILKCLEKEFEIKICHKPNNFIGIEVNKNSEGITLTQKNYIESLLNKFNMIDAKPCNIPGNIDKITCTDTTINTMFPYRELVGGLLYLSTRTRPDIAQAVNEASRKIENPNKTDVIAIKKILKYLSGTRDKGITYKVGGDISTLNAYCDSDYANDVSTRRSTTGFVIMLCNGPISWCSKRQPIVSLSSTEAEFIAAADCCKELLYLKSFICELITCKIKIVLNIDNQSSIKLIKTGSFNKRSKHIDVRYHFIHENYVKGNFSVEYCPTDQQVADILTKPLSKIKFQTHCKKLLSS